MFKSMKNEVKDICEKSLSGQAITLDEAVFLLSLPDSGLEASILRSVANEISRKRFAGEGVLQGQIGIDFTPCVADCAFCSFAVSHSKFDDYMMGEDDLVKNIKEFTESGASLSALFLMAHHEFDFENMLKSIELARKNISAQTKLVLNIGDFDFTQAQELKAAGATGSYHVVRLKEGIDTKVSKEDRLETIGSLKKAGLDWYYCCEPIGPEHSAIEIAEQIFIGNEYECYQNAAMRRVSFEHSPLLSNGTISELRLSNILAVASLAMVENKELTSMAVHEPCVTGLLAGANCLYAESGGNPRDTAKDTSEGRGHSIYSCKDMLVEANWRI